MEILICAKRVLELKADKNMNLKKNRVFIDEACFNMNVCRNFGRSKQDTPAKTLFPSSRGIIITIVGAICEKEVTILTLRKPKTAQKKFAGSKKRKRGDGKQKALV